MGRTWVIVLLCAACARGAGGGEATFAISYPEARTAKVKRGQRFYAKPAAQCRYDNGREASWRMTGARVTQGELPPGLLLEDGVIGGVPTQAGTFKATIELLDVTCAGKPAAGQVVDIQITVQ